MTSQTNQFGALLENAPDIVFEINPEGKFTYLNKGIAVLGYNARELMGAHFSTILDYHENKRVSRSAVLPQYKGIATGDENAPKLIDERRTGPRMTKNLGIQLTPRVKKETRDQQVMGHLHSCGRWDEKTNTFLGSMGIIHSIFPNNETGAKPSPFRKISNALLLEKVRTSHTPRHSHADQNRGKTRILVVNDNKRQAMKDISDISKDSQFQIDIFENGDAALNALRQAYQDNVPYHTAIVEKFIPGLDGESLGRTIKFDPHLFDIQLVLITSNGHRGDALRVQNIGFEAYLSRPVSSSTIHACLTMIQSRPKEGRAPAPILTKYTMTKKEISLSSVLIAEKDAISRALSQKIVESLGFQTATVGNAAEALTTLENVHFDILLIDSDLPQNQIDTIIAAIRHAKKNTILPTMSSMPIIAMTSGSSHHGAEPCQLTGADISLKKPITHDSVEKAIESIVTNTKPPVSKTERGFNQHR